MISYTVFAASMHNWTINDKCRTNRISIHNDDNWRLASRNMGPIVQEVAFDAFIQCQKISEKRVIDDEFRKQ